MLLRQSISIITVISLDDFYFSGDVTEFNYDKETFGAKKIKIKIRGLVVVSSSPRTASSVVVVVVVLGSE